MFQDFPGKPSASFGNLTRKAVVLKRDGLRPNVGSNLFRFRADVTWGNGGPGESREVPLLVTV